jgi:hypothetical protein
VRGSVGFSFKFLDSCATTLSHKLHWYQTTHPEYVISSALSGVGYFPVCSTKFSKLFLIFQTSDILFVSLASLAYHCKEVNAIVHRMAKMVITTMSSTRVNHFLYI